MKSRVTFEEVHIKDLPDNKIQFEFWAKGECMKRLVLSRDLTRRTRCAIERVLSGKFKTMDTNKSEPGKFFTPVEFDKDGVPDNGNV